MAVPAVVVVSVGARPVISTEAISTGVVVASVTSVVVVVVSVEAGTISSVVTVSVGVVVVDVSATVAVPMVPSPASGGVSWLSCSGASTVAAAAVVVGTGRRLAEVGGRAMASRIYIVEGTEVI